MKTSLAKTKAIEAYLENALSGEDSTLFSAKMVLDEQLAEQIQWQAKTYELVRQLGRQEVKAHLQAFYQEIMEQPKHQSLKQRLLSYFK